MISNPDDRINERGGGETGLLEGSRVLVTGATGEVGWGVAQAASRSGASLLLTTRSARKADALRNEFPGATVVEVDLAEASSDATFIEAVGERLDHVVAPMGSWWQNGASVEQDPTELTGLLAVYATAQLRLVRLTADALRASRGSYTMVTGAAGEALVPGGGLLVVAVRAQYALADVLRHELADDPIRFNELRIQARVERASRPGIIPSLVAGFEFVDLMGSATSGELVNFPS